jgi:hypothetical protein
MALFSPSYSENRMDLGICLRKAGVNTEINPSVIPSVVSSSYLDKKRRYPGEYPGSVSV